MSFFFTAASQRELYYVLAVLTAYAVVALGFLLFYLFKVDLVLAYRRVSPCLKQQDGEYYCTKYIVLKVLKSNKSCNPPSFSLLKMALS